MAKHLTPWCDLENRVKVTKSWCAQLALLGYPLARFKDIPCISYGEMVTTRFTLKKHQRLMCDLENEVKVTKSWCAHLPLPGYPPSKFHEIPSSSYGETATTNFCGRRRQRRRQTPPTGLKQNVSPRRGGGRHNQIFQRENIYLFYLDFLTNKLNEWYLVLQFQEKFS